MESEFRHEGTVSSIEGDVVTVNILQHSACSSCQARSICRTSESKEKTVCVKTCDAGLYRVGQSVVVTGSVHQGMSAVLVAFGIPLLLVLATVVIGKALDFSDALSAGLALAVLVPFYAVLFLLRDRIGKRFQFEISE